MLTYRFVLALLCVALLGRGWALAEELAPVTLENVEPPSPNAADEPLAEVFSLQQAVQFLDSAALTWQRDRQCFTCHTNYLFLMARPLVSADAPAHTTVRAELERMVTERWEKHGPRWNAEVVATAAFLAANDRATTGELHATTRTALDKMWTLQREDGGFDWLKCNWPPMESDDHYGATLAVLAVGLAPGDYAQTPQAQLGLAKLQEYFAANPAPTLHHRAMLLWADTKVPGTMTAEDRSATEADLLAAQRPDGGWAAASLGDWAREDGSAQDVETSDGYGTGFVIYVLRQQGLPADDAQLQRGIQWLTSNQRQSGRWYSRSLWKDNMHYLTHAGTAFAVMALAECGVQ